ncbi:MAG: FecR domain-containing protein, partial [Candidatus Omnitrophica bacterium]|nr:FecR domain-containing protein [Candidatus Omnitrophota bacterium]
MQISNRTNKIFKLFSFVVLSISLIAQPVVSVAAPAVADAPGNVVNSIAQTAGLAANAATGMLFASHSQKVSADEIGGDAQIQRKNSDVWEPIEEGSQVEGEDTIKTGENGRVRLTFDGKTVVYLTPNTELTVSEVSKKSGDIRTTLLNLKMGRLKAEVDKQKGESVFKVQTPTAIASVRGTVLYMGVTQTAQAVANMLTDLYVDEGVVDFAALSDALNNLMVDAFGASSISGDGTKLPLRRLTPEQRNEFIQAFDEAFEKAGNPQTEVESSGGDEEEGDDEGDDSSDGLNDKNSEQDTNGQQAIRNRRVILGLLLHSQLNRLSGVAGALNQLDVANTAIALAEGPADSGDWDLVTLMNRFDDGIVSADRLTSLDEIDMLLADSVDQVLNLNSQVLALQSLFAQALASDENGGLV